MSIPASCQELSTRELGVLAAELRGRRPRPDAASEIEIRSVPIRTCYETMMRLAGPRDAVLDYAAFLFAEEGNGRPAPTPPLTIEEGQIDGVSGIMSLVLSRGSFVQ